MLSSHFIKHKKKKFIPKKKKKKKKKIIFFFCPKTDKILEEHLPEEKLKEVRRLLYGKAVQELKITEGALELSKENDFEIKAYKFSSDVEQLRDPRIVRIGLIQNSVVKPTTEPYKDQVKKKKKKISKKKFKKKKI